MGLVEAAKEVELALGQYNAALAAENKADQDLKKASEDVAKANHELHQAEQEDAGPEVLKEIRNRRQQAFKNLEDADAAHKVAEITLSAATTLLGHALGDLLKIVINLPLFK